MIDLEEVVASVRAIASDCGSLVVDAMVDFKPSGVPVVPLDLDPFLALVRHLRPLLIYLYVLPFEAESQILGDLSIDGDDDFVSRTIYRKTLAKWSVRDGEPARVVLGCVHGGVLHACVEDSSWTEACEQDVERLAGEMQKLAMEREQREVAALETESRQVEASRLIMARALMADPRFSAPKVGVAKRMILAQEMFPDAGRDELRRVVTLAGEEHWRTATQR